MSQPSGAQRDQERWTPALHFNVQSGRCRLSLEGYAYGDGDTLQEAADDLVARLLTLALRFRGGSGFSFSSELPPVDFQWFEFLYELGEITARGEDIRPRVFGSGANPMMGG